MYPNSFDRFPCVAHMINLAVKHGLDNKEELPEVKKLVEKCKSIVCHFKHSAKATQELKRTAELTGMDGKATALVQEVCLFLST